MKNKLHLLFIIVIFLHACGNLQNRKTNIKITPLKTGTEASLRGLFVVDENTVWASGSEGTVLLTTDGGKTWSVKQIPGEEKNDFRSIHAWNKKRALVFGIAGPDFGYLTENGGNTWQPVFSNTKKGLFFNSLKFANESTGLAVSDPVAGKLFVIKTSDGGKTWRKITTIPDIIEGEANFAASNSCIEFLPSGKAWIATGGKAARVFYSSDFGESWQVAETPVIHGKASSGIFSISFKNDMEGVVVGGIYDAPEQNSNIAAYTTNGGKTWESAEKMPAEYRSCVRFVKSKNNSFFFACGKTGCDISHDGGKTWRFTDKTGFYSFQNIQNKTAGIASFENGGISKVSFTN